MIPDSFHFLRPAWLWATLALVPLLFWAWRRRGGEGAWARVCEPHLLRHLLATRGGRAPRWPLAAFALAWIASCIALAGPTWERLPQVAFEVPARTVFVLSLAPSMNQRDVAPSRIARARHKLGDALERLHGGSAALVVFREEAFAATPLTDDREVLRELIPLLDTRLAPGRSVHPARGIDEALALLEPAGTSGATLLLVADDSDDDPRATLEAAERVARAGAHLSVLSIAGNSAHLADVARAGDGTIAALSADDSDLAQLLPDTDDVDFGTRLAKSEVETDDWKDMGAWLVWLPLLLAPIGFRKGWVGAALLALCLQLPAAGARAASATPPGDTPAATRAQSELEPANERPGWLARASDWHNWFERPDQRAARAFEEQDYATSAETFEDPAWKAAARYRAGDYSGAAELLARRDDPRAQYNRGNALARAGQLEQALAAYDAALAEQPDDEDARFNRELVARLLEEQKKQQSQSQQGEQGKKSEQSQSGQGEQGEQSQSEQGEQSQSGQGEQSQSGQGEQGEQSQSEQGEQSQSEQGEQGEQSQSGQGEQSQQGESADASQDQRDGAAEAADATAGEQAGEERSEAGRPEQGDQGPPQDARGAQQEQAQGEPGDEQAQATAAAASNAAQPQQPGQHGPGATTRGVPVSPEDQEMARWMARLPDDPGGLLREKIRRDYQRKQATRRKGGRP